MLTANDIRSGRAFSVAVSAEYRKFLQTLVQAIDFCSERRNEEATLTKVGRAGFERINELFAKEQPPQAVPKDENDCEAAEKLLLTTWAYMIFYPKFTMERFAVYAEVNILLGEMLAGGWFE